MTRALILSVLVAAVTAGCATAPNPAPDARTAASNAVVATARAAKTPLADTQCVRDTGSFIKRTDERCRNIPGKSFSQGDLESTGELDVADALRQLDPSFH